MANKPGSRLEICLKSELTIDPGEGVKIEKYMCVIGLLVLLVSCSDSPKKESAAPITENTATSTPAESNVPPPQNLRNSMSYPSGLQTQKANKLLSRLGIRANTEYEYIAFSDFKTAHQIGAGGQFEYLKCAIPHDTTNPGSIYEASSQMKDMGTYWEVYYYKDLNQTWMTEVKNSPDRSTSSVRILKVVKGRDPDLNILWE